MKNRMIGVLVTVALMVLMIVMAGKIGSVPAQAFNDTTTKKTTDASQTKALQADASPTNATDELQEMTARYVQAYADCSGMGLDLLTISPLQLDSMSDEMYAEVMEKAEAKRTAETENGQENLDSANQPDSEQNGTEDDNEDEYANLAIAKVHNYVNVRSNPDTDSEIVGKMYDRSVAQIEESVEQEDGTWLQVVSGNVEGYIKAEYFIYGDEAEEVIDDYVIRYAQVNATRLNVRAEADISAKKIGYIDHGERVPYVETEGDWFKVNYTEQKQGYVSSEFASIVEEFVYAKSIEEEKAELEAKALLAKREAEARENAAAVPEEQLTIEAPVATYSTNSELRTQLINNAMQYLGNRYVHGGSSLAGGTDCSGFTSLLYSCYGYSLSRTPEGQLSSAGRSIPYEQIQPGDIICYTSNGSRCTHVGLYIGNGQIIHSANSRKGVIISDAHYSQILGVKNVID